MPNVLEIYDSGVIAPTALLLGAAQCEYLSRSGRIDYRLRRDSELTGRDIAWADTVILCRCTNRMGVAIAEAARKSGRRVAYVLDDDLFNVPAQIPIGGEYYNRPQVLKCVKRSIELADMIVTPSPVLKSKYGGVLMEEPALNRDAPRVHGDGKIRICYAGTPDRDDQLQRLLPEVFKRLCAEYGDKLEVTFFGSRPPFVDELGLKHIPYCESYEEYMRIMRKCGFDIGLSPLMPTEFNRCKHYNKLIEYASFGIVGIYSNVEPYTRAVVDGKNGLLCENTEEAWYRAIKRLIDAPALLKQLREECVNEARGRFAVETVAEDYYTGVCAYERRKKALWVAPLYDITRLYVRLGRHIKGLMLKIINYLR